MITIIAACDEGMVIGNEGKIPWYYPEDMTFFKNTTIGHTVVMGRKTWESVGLLPNRLSVVISRKPPSETKIKPSDILEPNLVLRNLLGIIGMPGEIFIIGGGEIYSEALSLGIVNRILLTRVPGRRGGDTFFPIEPIDHPDWDWMGSMQISDSLRVDKYDSVKMRLRMKGFV